MWKRHKPAITTFVCTLGFCAQGISRASVCLLLDAFASSVRVLVTPAKRCVAFQAATDATPWELRPWSSAEAAVPSLRALLASRLPSFQPCRRRAWNGTTNREAFIHVCHYKPS